jgi:hypothetical protein
MFHTSCREEGQEEGRVEPDKTPRKRASKFIKDLVAPAWQPSRDQVLLATRIVLVLVVLLAILTLIGLPFGITLWAWVKLLIVPAVLAIGGYLFNSAQSRATQAAAEIAAERRAQDEALQSYIDQMSQLLTDEELPLHSAQPGDSPSTVARARTLTVLGRLDSGRKRSVLQFLYESGLIYKEKTLLNESDLIERRHNIVSLGGADLRGADLSGANLSGADLSRTNLLKTDLRGANLSGADLLRASLFETYLSRADLSGAYLVEAELYGAHLSSANLTNADLRGAYLGGAGLSDANLNDANLRNAQGPTGKKLEDMAKTLEGATMPDGSKHP